MPALATHYCFGQLLLPSFSPNMQTLIGKYKNTYDLGLQGPDLLFFHKPFSQNKIRDLGSVIHSKKAKQFFETALRNCDSDEAFVYIIASCLHYSLDRICHPLIGKLAPTEAEHNRLEADFDLYILSKFERDQKRHKYAPISNIDFKEVAKVYPELKTRELKTSAQYMRNMSRLLEKRTFVTYGEKLIGKAGAYSPLTMDKKADLAYLDDLYELFLIAKTDALILVDETKVSIKGDKILRNFELNFNGELVRM